MFNCTIALHCHHVTLSLSLSLSRSHSLSLFLSFTCLYIFFCLPLAFLLVCFLPVGLEIHWLYQIFVNRPAKRSSIVLGRILGAGPLPRHAWWAQGFLGTCWYSPKKEFFRRQVISLAFPRSFWTWAEDGSLWLENVGKSCLQEVTTGLPQRSLPCP